jgi:iron complex transport system permease protein
VSLTLASSRVGRPPASPEDRDVVRRSRAATARRHRTVLAGLGLLLLGLLAARVLLGDFTVTVPDFIRILGGETIPGATYLVLEVKLPRAVLALLAGAAFGVAGALCQTVLRNPLATPDLVGISIGASAAAVFAIVELDLDGVGVSLAAVGGAVLTGAAVRAVAGSSTWRLVVVGIAAAAALQSVIQYLFTRADTYDAQLTLRWLAGSVSSATWDTIRLLGLALLLLLPLVVRAVRALPALELGDEAAAGLGVPTRRADEALLVAVVLVAVAVAAAGPIAFVAFVAGPLARALNAGRATVAGSALVGAAIVVGADYLADYVVPGGNYPVGVVTGALGAPFLLWQLNRRTR